MTKKKNYTLVFLVVAVIVLAIIFWPKKNPVLPDEKIDTGGGSTGESAVPVSSSKIFPIKKGDQNEQIRYIQKTINDSWNYYGNGNKRLVEDGIFGSKTAAALLEFFPDFNGTITEQLYNYIIARRKQGVPLGRRVVKDDVWPIQMGDIDSLGSSRIKKVNIGLGLYPFNTTDNGVHEFSKETKRALRLKANVGSISKELYDNMVPAFKWAPTIYIN